MQLEIAWTPSKPCDLPSGYLCHPSNTRDQSTYFGIDTEQNRFNNALGQTEHKAKQEKAQSYLVERDSPILQSGKACKGLDISIIVANAGTRTADFRFHDTMMKRTGSS